jgi:hypothetical protein
MWRVDQGMGGTRFRLFPQPPFMHPGRPPQLVTIAMPPGSIGPGPSDDRLYLIDPIGKRAPYGIRLGRYGTPYLDLPPWRGPIRPPVQPDADGHFDQIPVGTPEFEGAHVFGSIRFALGIWERYFGRRIPWHFERDFDRLEVVMLPNVDTSHVGYGFMEIGAAHFEDGTVEPFALNFDIVGHEFGHLIIYGTLGVPTPETQRGEYFGFQEAAADITALISVLHFDTMIDDLLAETSGNLYTFNELSRFASLSPTSQIRLAVNSMKMSAFAAGWDDEHLLSQPLTGALFDILVDMFQENLVARGLISRDVAELARVIEGNPGHESRIQAEFDAAYPDARPEFREALIEARDTLGLLLAETWKRLSPDYFNYIAVGEILIAVDMAMTGGRHRREIVESFVWREIGRVSIGPRVSPPDARSHAFSARTLLPEMRHRLPKMTYRERTLVARNVR